ncbi:NUDIX hydrolase [Deinococcus malanensis]|uniref:NUDIX hydrolase n=1 Tax=Deinococcus malanensis TaxID=1706855 RepID=A0ABQ2EM08_9DEIO|nr:NUDIX domain-containing protein [Deinococcus malanensis]GGK12657.1 NUDIX hydrolase [Deinococcus malanensis]
MRHRISAAGVVLRGDQLLMVHHHQPGAFDFWVPPGGGVEGHESLLQAAEREVHEETGLSVRAERILYLQELVDGDSRICKSFVRCHEVGGALSQAHRVDDEREVLVEARFMTAGQMTALDVRPPVFRDVFWQDLRREDSGLRYLGPTVCDR